MSCQVFCQQFDFIIANCHHHYLYNTLPSSTITPYHLRTAQGTNRSIKAGRS